MAKVYVSIGSNVDRAANIRSGVRALQARFGAVRLSSVYDTPAVGFSGDDFYNLVAAFDTLADVHEVAAFLHETERRHGRAKRGAGRRYTPRTLDMDLLLYGDLVLEGPDLRLPRAEILQHAFVLGPLAEIAAGERHPELGLSFGELWARLVEGGASLEAVEFDWE